MVSLVVDRKRVIGFLALLLGAVICLTGFFSGVRERPRQTVKTSAPTAGNKPRVTFTLPGEGQDFFVESRLTRDRVTSQRIALDQEIANNPASSDQLRRESQQELMQLSEQMGKETELERLIMARGYPEAVVVIQDKSATVIIQSRVLQPEEVDKIVELVAKGADRDPGSVTVIPRP